MYLAQRKCYIKTMAIQTKISGVGSIDKLRGKGAEFMHRFYNGATSHTIIAKRMDSGKYTLLYLVKDSPDINHTDYDLCVDGIETSSLKMLKCFYHEWVKVAKNELAK